VWDWIVHALQDPGNAASTLLSLLVSAVVAGVVRGRAAAKRDTERMIAAGRQPPMNDDEPTGRHALPTDAEVIERQSATIARQALDLETAHAEVRLLRIAARDRADELEQVKGERENYLYRWVDARDHALHLRRELARALGVPENSPSIPPAPRTLGSQSALQPITVPPEGDDRVTPPQGTRGIRVPRETP
jgi:hypothetical protein